MEKLEGEAGEQVIFDEVLAISDDNASRQVTLRLPLQVRLSSQGKNKKVTILNLQGQEGYRLRTDTGSLILVHVYLQSTRNWRLPLSLKRDVAHNIRCVYMSDIRVTASRALISSVPQFSPLLYGCQCPEDICGYDNEDFSESAVKETEDVNVRIEVR